MSNLVLYTPEEFHTLQPVINVADVNGVLTFVSAVFNAVETDRYNMPDGSPAHVEMRIGDSTLTVGPPDPLGAFPAKLFVYVEDADATFARALAAGAEALAEPADQFYGQRVGRVKDPFGNIWMIATQIELLTKAETQARFQALFNS